MDRRRVPSYAQDALDTLRQAVAANSGETNGIPTRKARTVLADEEDLSDPAVDTVLEVLYNCGEIYYVDEELRITEIEPSNTETEADTK